MGARIAVVATLCWLAAAPAWAEPVGVTLYPGAARVREAADLGLEQEGEWRKAVFELPGQADPASVRVSAGRGRVGDLRFRRLARIETGEARELKERIKKAEAEADALSARIQTLDARIDFWRTQARPEKADAATLRALSQVVGESVEALYRDKLPVEAERKEAEKRLAELRLRLEQVAGQQEEALEATALLADVPAGSVRLEWSYDLPDCGWSPAYRLEGFPAEKKVLLAFEAEAWQNSGRAWRNVELTLATARPSATLTPPPVRPWVIGPRQPVMPMAAPAADMAVAKEATPRFAVAAAPAREERASFDLWRLGKRSVPAGEKQRLFVSSEAWGAEFSYLLRPAQSRLAYVRAEIDRKETADLPPGPALVEYDGALIGRREFRLEPGDRSVFFGVDPQISARMRALDRKSGEKGFIGKEQTMAWSWEIAVKNDKAAPVSVRLEEPMPRAGDERVKVEWSFDPQPAQETVGQGAEESPLFVWTLDVPPRSEKSVRYGVTARAPADMALDPGRR